MALLIRHRLMVSHDTMINYAHVWYVSQRLWDGHGIPFRMPVLGHGQAFAFPYGVVPWLTAAVARPLAGDWIVTLWIVLGIAGLLVATFVAFPELRRGWWAATLLINPALVAAAVIGQMPFTWGAALLLLAIAAWRRGRPGWAAVLGALGQVTHPAVVAPLAFGLVALRLPFEPKADGRRRRLLRWYGLSLIPMIPATLLVVRSPVFEESSTWVKLSEFVTTLVPRSGVLVIPVTLMLLLRPAPRGDGGCPPDRGGVSRQRQRGWIGPAAFVVTAAVLALSWRPLLLPEASRSLWRKPDQAMLRFLASPAFHPGATYRVLRVPDFKVGMYQMLRAGGRLDSEFFPESIVRRRWPSATDYGEFLRRRHVDYVMIWGGYGRVFHANDADRLTELEACRPGAPVCARILERTEPWTLWEISRPSGAP
ncbi:MAG: hypothetical protein LC792_08915 [Actinobacteria bacterium]|nr:hypothetical protein [Actinomycetota bacterium]